MSLHYHDSWIALLSVALLCVIFRPLVHLAMRTFQRYEVLQYLLVDEGLMYAWLQMIESNYHASNPYHNSTHAADVMHATSYFLACDKIKVKQYSSS